MILARFTHSAKPGHAAAVRDLLDLLGPLHAQHGGSDRTVSEAPPGTFEETIRFADWLAFDAWDDKHATERRVAAVWVLLAEKTRWSDFEVLAA